MTALLEYMTALLEYLDLMLDPFTKWCSETLGNPLGTPLSKILILKIFLRSICPSAGACYYNA